MNFIKTENEKMAIILREHQYQELPKEGSFFVFINSNKMNFGDCDRKNLIFTNVLHM